MDATLMRSDDTDRRWWILYASLAVLAGVIYTTSGVGLPASVAGVAGLLFLVLGIRSIWQLVAAGSVEQVDVGGLAARAGPVSIEGTARPAGEPVTAPMTGTESVAYRVEVLQHEPDRTDG